MHTSWFGGSRGTRQAKTAVVSVPFLVPNSYFLLLLLRLLLLPLVVAWSPKHSGPITPFCRHDGGEVMVRRGGGVGGPRAAAPAGSGAPRGLPPYAQDALLLILLLLCVLRVCCAVCVCVCCVCVCCGPPWGTGSGWAAPG